MGSERLPLLQKQCVEDYGHAVTRTGNVWTAVAHIITGMIGSGVLSLSWSMAHLGWLAGPAAIFSFAAATLFTSFLLSSCHVTTTTSNSYFQTVRTNLGSTNGLLCGLILSLVMCGYGIAYTVTTSISMRSISDSYSHGQGQFGDWLYMVIFGCLQIFLSQIPNFHNIQWLSVVAAIMSLTYALIGFGLGLATLIGNGYAKGSVIGVSSPNKVWLISQALGDIAFSYPFSIILFEIQDTLRSPPPQSKTMKAASTISIVVTTFFYLFCGGFGYAAFGDETPGNLMTAFRSSNRLLDLANACIVLHLVGGYQIYSQPLFASVEKWLAEKLPESEFVSKEYPLKIRPFREFNVNPLRICFRTAYVVSTTTIAIVFPYFNQILGVLGGLNFWPMTIYFPVEMYLRQSNIEPWTTKWILLRIFSAGFLLITLFSLVGSIQGIISAKLR